MNLPLQQRGLRVIGHQRWMRGRDRILRAFSHPDHQKPYPFEVDFFGLPYSGDLTNFIDWLVFYYGCFAPEELSLLSALADALRARGGLIHFFDVGANIGHHSLYMSQHADAVFGSEPFHVVRAELERKMKHARVTNVKVFPVALGSLNETATFTPPTGANQGTGTLGSKLPENASKETIFVDVVRGDDYFMAHGLPPVTLMKIDVEGFEVSVLEGMQETLRRDRPPILMEIQQEEMQGSDIDRGTSLRSLLYPEHVILQVENVRGKYRLEPFSPGKTREALVLPRELRGILPNT